MRIFVVENHRDTLKYLKMYLESLGHTVTTASTMQAALDASPTEDCQVLISDLGLPDGDGWQLLEQAKFPRPVYAVAMSGFATASDMERSMAAGFQRHIAKPFGEEDICEALKEAARHIITRPPETHVVTPTAREEQTREKMVVFTPAQITDRLHDNICQHFTGAYLLLSVLSEKLANDTTEARQLLDKATKLLGEAGTELTTLMNELRTAGAEDSEAKRSNPSGN